jgi:Xaa-Pro aminopeptidase
MSVVDRDRASRLIGNAGLDALVVAEPEGFTYIAGAGQGVAGLFRRAGAGFAVLPADPNRPIGVVIGDLNAAAAHAHGLEVRSHPLWMEAADLDGAAGGPIEARIAEAWRKAGRSKGFARPATFDLGLALAALADLLGTLGLAESRLGFDFDYVAESDARVIRSALPKTTISNGSPVLDRLRMVKTPAEIARLQLAVQLAEAGLRALTDSVRADHGPADLHAAFRSGIEAESALRDVPAPPSWDYIAVGPDPWDPRGRVGKGTIIKADVGCVIEGYSSDTSRNYVFAAPTADQAKLHFTIEAAFAAGLEQIRPGVPLATVHETTRVALESAGLVGFSRGHFGHGLGHSLFSEQWPFISADEDTLIEPGMVLAFEVPIYVKGLGAFNLEDQILVTAEGHQSMNTLPRGLVVVGK